MPPDTETPMSENDELSAGTKAGEDVPDTLSDGVWPEPWPCVQPTS